MKYQTLQCVPGTRHQRAWHKESGHSRVDLLGAAGCCTVEIYCQSLSCNIDSWLNATSLKAVPPSGQVVTLPTLSLSSSLTALIKRWWNSWWWVECMQGYHCDMTCIAWAKDRFGIKKCIFQTVLNLYMKVTSCTQQTVVTQVTSKP